MAYWLMKSEPDVFSFADLEAVTKRGETEPWNGIRNYQARNFLRQMQVGDLCLFYHSNTRPPHIAGVMRVTSAAYPDDLQFDESSDYFDPKSSADDPRWSMVDVAAVAAFDQPLTLERLRELTAWECSPLTKRGNRLSVMPVTQAELEAALAEGGLDAAQLA